MATGRREGQFSFDLGGDPPPAPAGDRAETPIDPQGAADDRAGSPTDQRAEEPTRDPAATPTHDRAATPTRDEADLPTTGHPDQPGLPGAASLVRSLARISAEHPLDRKVIVCRTGGEGRELLRQLALRAGSWVGFEATTTRKLAITVAGPALAARGIRLTDTFDEEGLLDEAIDEVLLGGGEDEHARMARGVGMRRALARAVTTLRLAGVRAGRIRDATLADAAKARILSGDSV